MLKIIAPLLSLLLILPSIPAAAQEQPKDLDTMMRDASYVLNRYDEATTGYETDIAQWKIPGSLRENLKSATDTVRQSAERQKFELNSLIGRKAVPTEGLFDLYDELQMVASDLDSAASGYLNWGDNEAAALELTKLGAKTRILAANLSIVLRAQIVDHEAQLGTCSKLLKPRVPK